MMNVRPPRWAQKFIEWYCKPSLAEDLIGDLNEYFERNVETLGPRRAKLIYIVDSFKFLRTYTVRTLKFITFFTSFIMIGSYIKTSGRNVMRNKLFSSINIIGLAISMSVGLLLIAYLHDLLSYDRFQEKGDRIYRIVTHPKFRDQDWGRFASASYKTGKLIEEKIPGIESVTMLRQEFSHDAIIGDNTIPVSGLYAQPSFFNIFSFPLIKGDQSTCLKEPKSILLTEQSAKKLFGNAEALGQSIKFDTIEYQVTGILKDIPFFSHVRFEVLVSMSTLEQSQQDLMEWTDMWGTFVYLLLPENADLTMLRANLDEIARVENEGSPGSDTQLDIQPLHKIVLGESLGNSLGPTISTNVVWILAGLALTVVLSACFNYTNLSMARSLRRFKEVGLRKVIGAGSSQVRQQFIYEAIIISLAALVLSFGIYVAISAWSLSLLPLLDRLVRLELTPLMIACFVAFAVLVGLIAGILPALFFARVSVLQALKDVSSLKVFRHINLRKSLIVAQYSFTLIFITATVVGYNQYKSFLSFDLGFDTANIINVRLNGNNSNLVVKEFAEIPEVVDISRSRVITSIGNYWGAQVKYRNMNDSSAVWFNMVDENYLPLHNHKFIAGSNFIARPANPKDATEVIVNRETLVKFGIGDPNDPRTAVGEQIIADRRKLSIVGVIDDFHYGKVDNKIEPVIFVYWTTDRAGFVNLKIQSADLPATMAKLEQAWRKVDKTNPLEAKFYSDAIEAAYVGYSLTVKIIGILSVLAIVIASIGLLGMVVFTTETRLREISIRKVLGANARQLVILLSRNFIVLLGISAVIAIPTTYFFFEGVLLPQFPYHKPVEFVELFIGLVAVLLIAVLMIGTQTLKAAHSSPSEVLKNE